MIILTQESHDGPNVSNHRRQNDRFPFPPSRHTLLISPSPEVWPSGLHTTHLDDTKLNGSLVLWEFRGVGRGWRVGVKRRECSFSCSYVGKVHPRRLWQEIALIQNWAEVISASGGLKVMPGAWGPPWQGRASRSWLRGLGGLRASPALPSMRSLIGLMTVIICWGSCWAGND